MVLAGASSVSASSRLQLPGSGQGLLVAAVDASSGSSGSVVVLGAVPIADDAGAANAADAVQALLPGSLRVVGTYSSGPTPPAWVPCMAPALTASNTAAGAAAAWSVNGQAQPSGLPAAPASKDGDAAALLDVAAGFVPLRAHVQLELRLVCPASSTASTSTAPVNGKQKQAGSAAPVPPASAVKAGVQQLQDQLLAQPQQVVFVPEAKQQQQQGRVALITASSSSTVREAIPAGVAGNNPCASLTLLQHTSQQQSGKALPAPMFEFQPPAAQQQQQQLVTLPLSLDVLCYAPASASLAAVHTSLLVPALQQQLAGVQELLLQQAARGEAVQPIRALHFSPPGLGFPVTLCYPILPGSSQEAAEAALLQRRQQLHALLGLPSDRPMLRLANALAWAAPAGDGGDAEASGPGKSLRLRNVHEALTPPAFGGRLYLVDGAYEYCHYMQDKFNDAGWGCAYRSLQTIVSWFRAQNYTSKPVPGHRQIQELLVAIGDKEPSFVGSSQWIGSFELSYLLDEYLGVTCKTLAINQGADIPSHARALAAHFEAQGTPVMIGGGVLAYTLLGVAWNEETGEAAFLILDPHFTGGEDLKKITQGGWVAWKQLGDSAAAGGPLFVKDAFYNFLCPQRPRTV